MKRTAACLFILSLLFTASCEPEPGVKTSEPQTSAVADAANGAVIFLTGNEMGELKPCGCSGGQLGGLDRRGAVWSGVEPERRIIVDTGNMLETTGEQDLIKFNILAEGFALLGYDVVNMNEQDLAVASDLALLQRLGSQYRVISAYGGSDGPRASFSKTLQSPDGQVRVKIGAFDTMTSGVEEISPLFAGDFSGVEILLIDRHDMGVIEEIRSAWPAIEVIVCPSDMDEPAVIAGASGGPLAVSLGHFGRYVTRLDVKMGSQGPEIAYSKVAVKEGMKTDPQLVSLYQTYQVLVREANLLENYPKLPAPGGLKYVGSSACKMCHQYEYDKWSTKAHADALASLVQVGSDYDPECVICHVVGMKYESGYISPAKTPHLKDVGCENCHGPGSAHVGDPQIKTAPDAGKVCRDCHTPEKSTHYAGNEAEYLEKIVHWREP